MLRRDEVATGEDWKEFTIFGFSSFFAYFLLSNFPPCLIEQKNLFFSSEICILFFFVVKLFDSFHSSVDVTFDSVKFKVISTSFPKCVKTIEIKSVFEW